MIFQFAMTKNPWSGVMPFSTSCLGYVCGYFRKMVCWRGDFDEFIYIDLDTVILENFDRVFEYLDEYSFITAHSNEPKDFKYVWKDSIRDVTYLTPSQINYAANMGFFVSKKGALSEEMINEGIKKALSLRAHMIFDPEISHF